MFDDFPGFGLRVGAGGSRQRIVQCRNAIGQTKRDTLGRVVLLSSTDARRAASERPALAKLGSDSPDEEHFAEARATVTFGSKTEQPPGSCCTRRRFPP